MITKESVEKPVSKTVVASSGATNLKDLFSIPWNKIGYLDLVEAYNSTANDATIQVKDSYEDGVTGVSGFETRKELRVLSGDEPSADVKKDLPLLGNIRLQSNVSGFRVTVAAQVI